MGEVERTQGSQDILTMNTRQQNTMKRSSRQDIEDALIAETLRFLVKLQIDSLPQELIAEREKLIRSMGYSNNNTEWEDNQNLHAPSASQEQSEGGDEAENIYQSLFTDENDKLQIMTHTDIASLCGGLISTAEVLTSKAEMAGWLWREQMFHRKHRYWVLIYKDAMFLYLNSKGKEIEKIQLNDCTLKKHRKGTSFILCVADKVKGTSEDFKFHTSSTELAQKWTQKLIAIIEDFPTESSFASQHLKPPKQPHLCRAPSLLVQERRPVIASSSSTHMNSCLTSKCALTYNYQY